MADPEDVNFLDLACLFKIVPDITLEKFGSAINAGVFDTPNIVGNLKLKGLIDFTTYYPGPNSMALTEAGKKLEDEANAKGAEPMDALDDEILRQMSGGKRFPTELQSTLNIRSKDLALRIYKLFKQHYLGYELRSGRVELMLTEQGFLKAKPGPLVQAPRMQLPQHMQEQAQQPEPQMQTQPEAQMPQPQPEFQQQAEQPQPEFQQQVLPPDQLSRIKDTQLRRVIGQDQRNRRLMQLFVIIVGVGLAFVVLIWLARQGYIQLPFNV